MFPISSAALGGYHESYLAPYYPVLSEPSWIAGGFHQTVSPNEAKICGGTWTGENAWKRFWSA
eukprot:4344027-Amphidinium_carterae.1